MRPAKHNEFAAIRIPKNFLVRAEKRAKDMGFATTEAYVNSLLLLDLTKAAKDANRKSENSAPTQYALLHPVGRFSNRGQRRQSAVSLRKDLLDGMFSYMKASEDPGFGYACGYQLKHIDRCAATTRDFMKSLSARPKNKTAARVVEEIRRVVLKLNRLNASCGGALIATDQREKLCQFIMTVAQSAGLKIDRDITEQWRGW